MLSHRLAECKRGPEVVLIILDRLPGRFADCLITCKVNDRVDLLFIKQGVQSRLIAYVPFIESRALACDLLNAVYDHRLGIVEVIRDDDFISGLKQLDYGVTSDKTCSACN